MNRRDTLKTLSLAPCIVAAHAVEKRVVQCAAEGQQACNLLVLNLCRAAIWVDRETYWVHCPDDVAERMRSRAEKCFYDNYHMLYVRKYSPPFIPMVDESMVEMQIDPSIRNILLVVSDPWNGQPLIGDMDFPHREVDCNWARKFSASVSATGIQVHLAILRDRARRAPAAVDRVLSIIERQVGFSSPVRRHEFSTDSEQDIWDVLHSCGAFVPEGHQFRLAALTLIEFIESTMCHISNSSDHS